MILVTGGSGRIGSKIVGLLAKRTKVRVLIRPDDNDPFGGVENIEIFRGDVSNISDLERAFKDVKEVIHLAAVMQGDEDAFRMTIHQGTKNIIELCKKFRVSRLVYFSTLSVYKLSSISVPETIDETYPLEDNESLRGNYTKYKLYAEQEVLGLAGDKINVLVVRPGEVFSYETPHLPTPCGYDLGPVVLTFYDKKANLPLIELNELIDVFFRIYERFEAQYEVFNIVDPLEINQKDFFIAYRKITGYKKIQIRIPFVLVHLIFKVVDLRYSDNRFSYRLTSAIGPRKFSVLKIGPYIKNRDFTGLKEFVRKS